MASEKEDGTSPSLSVPSDNGVKSLPLLHPSYLLSASSVLTPLCSPGDMQLLIQTYRDVNKHLDSKVEELTEALEGMKRERDAWQRRCELLTQTLQTTQRQATTPLSSPVDPGALEKLCASITDTIPEDELARDGVLIRSLMERGLMGHWFILPEEITLLEVLGEGAFGKTYLAQRHGAQVCVKCVRVDTRQDHISFYREIEALSCLRHPNVMPFVGACLERPDHCWLICEYMAGGTLAKWLHGDQAKPKPLITRLERALEVARGMEACSKCDPVLVHRDLKPSNIFLDASGAARIGDFGLARRMNPEGMASLTGETGTYLYMSPEMIKHESYGTETDVWSWAVLTCELITKRLPYAGHYLTPIQVAVGVSEGRLKPSFPKDVHPRLTTLLEAAVKLDPAERPSFEWIVTELTIILQELKQSVASPQLLHYPSALFRHRKKALCGDYWGSNSTWIAPSRSDLMK